MPIIDLSKILSQNKSGWIALSPKDNKFIAKKRTLKALLKETKEKGVNNPIVFKSAPVKNLFAG